MKIKFFQAISVLLMLVACFFVSGCDNISSNEAVVLIDTKQIRLHAGSDMQMDYQIDGELSVNRPATISLSFQLEPHQLIELDVQDSERFEWMSMLAPSYQANEVGAINIEMQITPIQAGKAYIKFIAATIDGTSIRAFAIPLAIYDNDNSMPVKQKIDIDRINLPAVY